MEAGRSGMTIEYQEGADLRNNSSLAPFRLETWYVPYLRLFAICAPSLTPQVL